MNILESPPEWWAILLFSVRLLVSVLATVDILLRKNDVRAAFGWIAAVWFSPIIGGGLYYLFGINRVERRAARLSKRILKSGRLARPVPADLAPHVGELSKISQRITSVPLSAGNTVSILEGGDKAYSEMLAAIDGARHSIALASYIFRDDRVGNEFIDALIGAAGRGVQVRVLLDSIGAGYFFPRTLARLQRGGVVAEQFLHTWIPWRMPFLNMRSHRKLLVCDGVLGFTGGMNIGAEYAEARARQEKQDYVQDTHFRLEGPAVSQLMETFAQDWSFTTGEELNAACWWPDIGIKGSACIRGIRSGPDADIYKVETLLGAMLNQAKRRVRIVTPYFLPSQNLQFSIMEALLRGVTVEIVIPQECDYVFMDWAIRGHLRTFRHIPASIYFSAPPFDHSKLATMDDEWCLVGSSNWDIRSHRLNFEFDLECYDADLSSSINALIDAKIAGASSISPAEIASWPKWVQIRNAAARLLLPYL